MEIHERPLMPEGSEKHGLVIESIEYGNGIRVHVQGHTMPFKGMPTEGAVNAVAVIKKLLRLQPLQAMWTAIEPQILKEDFRQPITKEICTMFPSKLGITVAHVLEYDSAYRLFIQDLLSETTKDALLQRPYREIRRLLQISDRRLAQNPVVRKKMHYIGHIFLILLRIPSFRRKLSQGDFSKLQADESDKYWISLRTDYLPRA